MKHFVFLYSTFIFIVSCSSMNQEHSSVAGAQWYNQMHRLSENHSALVDLIDNPTDFYDPQNYPLIQAKTKALAEAALAVKAEPTAPDANPVISFTSTQFANELTAISHLVDTQQMQLAHYKLSNMSNYCISCHSRADRGTKNFPVEWRTEFHSKTSSPQKALYLLANRQYESAHQEVEKLMSNNQLIKADPKKWFSVVQKDLAVLIRVQEDLKQAEKRVTAILNNKQVPAYIKKDVKLWKQNLIAWQKEKKEESSAPRFAQAQALVDISQKPPYTQNEAGFILNLRASAILNLLLEGSRNSSQYATYLYLSGFTAEALKNVDIWSLNQNFWETCIEVSPNTHIAQQCYQQLEKTTLKNSSSLTPTQADLQRLAKFKDLSLPLNPTFEKSKPEK